LLIDYEPFIVPRTKLKKFWISKSHKQVQIFFVEAILFSLKLFNEVEGLKLEVASERAIQRKRNAIRPDISIWRGDTLLAAIECKTQLGWRRHDWTFHFDEREKKLKEIFPTATMFLLVMTGCNWPGFGNDPRSGKQMLCLLKDLWPTQIPKSFDPLILETPIERLLEQVKCL